MDVHFIYFKKIILLEWKVRREGTRDSESESVVMLGSRLMEIHHSIGMVPGCDVCKYDKKLYQVKLSTLVNCVSCHSEKAKNSTMSFSQIVSHGSVLHFRSSIRTANGRSLAASCSHIILCYNSSSQKTRCL